MNTAEVAWADQGQESQAIEQQQTDRLRAFVCFTALVQSTTSVVSYTAVTPLSQIELHVSSLSLPLRVRNFSAAFEITWVHFS